jgi:hypothetical protein
MFNSEHHEEVCPVPRASARKCWRLCDAGNGIVPGIEGRRHKKNQFRRSVPLLLTPSLSCAALPSSGNI